MKKNIALLAGGDSSEYEISLQSAEQISKLIDKKKYNVFTILVKGAEWVLISNKSRSGKIKINKDDFSFTINNKKTKFHFAFIAIHGTPGEDGKLQAYFELLNIPYSTSGVLSSSLAFNKYACKAYLKHINILTPKSLLVRKVLPFGEDLGGAIVKDIGLPCFIKPNEGGSSFGITKVTDKHNIKKAILKAFEEDKEVIIEEFIKGTELTCGLVKTLDKEIVFPITEIVSKKEYFDYEAKYTIGMADEITPARISKSIELKCKQVSSEIYNALNCRGIVRIDYILSNNKLYFLEINTVPGMTQKSIIPKQAETMGLSIKELFTMVIEDAIKRSRQ